ncbi:DNA polymerase III subunit [Dehalogenimonas sp. THU2]|uniref:DNA polymerase III subunit n=1 Tax=Dehalogenimonas sp. THU2 TaxID=3151121 RepID=UPI0032188EB5
MSSGWHLIGQDNVVTYLARSLKAGALSHAYLLSAPENSGKTTLAIKLAQVLNCIGVMIDGAPCEECEPCRRIAERQHSDVQIINIYTGNESGKSRVELSIEQVRGVTHAASMPPYEGRYRVFIIEDAEKLSTGAANALLKTLEEPSPQVLFVLTTSKENQLPETVRSRCVKLRLAAAPRTEISRFLEDELGFTASRADLLSRLSQGRAGWAIMAAKEESVLDERRDNLDRFFEAIEGSYDGRFDLAAKLAQRFSQKRDEVYRLLEQWLFLARDILLQKLDITDGIINTDYEIPVAGLAERLSITEIRSLIGSLAGTLQHLEQNASARLALEVLMLSMPLPGGSLKKSG